MGRGIPAVLVWVGQHAPPFTLDPDLARITVGRSVDSTMVIADPTASRLHAVFEHGNGEWIVTDVSTHGIELKSLKRPSEMLRGTSRHLRHGDVLVLGSTPLRFQLGASGGGGEDGDLTPPLAGMVRVTLAQLAVLMELSRPMRETPGAGPAANSDIAGALFVTENTVRKHLQALYRAFEVVGTTQTQRRAMLAEQWWRAEIHPAAGQG
ncbi:MAG TPA: FHA domain-containing protein [Solirubrobacterales bacterium]|nr:FHA domain-containing protein [Solirubrobacterales bacterium]